MAIDIEALGIHQLSVLERLTLIEQIWETLPEQVDPQEVPDWHLAELAVRRANADAQPGQGRPWRDALADIEDNK
jgi:putative addiction module component (TIGR02574 family)